MGLRGIPPRSWLRAIRQALCRWLCRQCPEVQTFGLSTVVIEKKPPKKEEAELGRGIVETFGLPTVVIRARPAQWVQLREDRPQWKGKSEFDEKI